VAIDHRVRRDLIEYSELPDARGQIQTLILLIQGELRGGQHRDDFARVDLFLSGRVWLERHRRIERLLQYLVGLLEQLGCEAVALPELERETVCVDLIGNRSQQEPAARAQVVVVVERATAFERKIGRVYKVLVKGKQPRVHIVDSIVLLAVYHEHYMRKRIEAASIVSAGQLIKVRAVTDLFEPAACARLLRLPFAGAERCKRAKKRDPNRSERQCAVRPERQCAVRQDLAHCSQPPSSVGA